MAGTSSVSGLVSGLDTSSIITQLMQVEAQTQTNLKSRLSTEQTTLKSLQDVNSAFASLATTFGDLASVTDNAWNPVTVTSSSDQVSATAGATTQAGPVTFTVGQVGDRPPAHLHRHGAADRRGHQRLHLRAAHRLRRQLPGPRHRRRHHAGPRQRAQRLGDRREGDHRPAGRRQLPAAGHRDLAPGRRSSFTLTNTDGTDLLGGATVVTRPGRGDHDRPGHGALGHQHLHRPHQRAHASPSASGAAPGTVVTLDAAQDTASMTDKVKAAVRPGQRPCSTRSTRPRPTTRSTKTSGPLGGDATVKQLRDALRQRGAADLPARARSPAVGIQLDRYGKLVFDATRFSSAYAADPPGSRRADSHRRLGWTAGSPAGCRPRREVRERPGDRDARERDQGQQLGDQRAAEQHRRLGLPAGGCKRDALPGSSPPWRPP